MKHGGQNKIKHYLISTAEGESTRNRGKPKLEEIMFEKSSGIYERHKCLDLIPRWDFFKKEFIYRNMIAKLKNIKDKENIFKSEEHESLGAKLVQLWMA